MEHKREVVDAAATAAVYRALLEHIFPSFLMFAAKCSCSIILWGSYISPSRLAATSAFIFTAPSALFLWVTPLCSLQMPAGPPCSPKATHNDQKDEVDEVVEGVCIHDEVHDVHPAFQRDDLVETGRENKLLKAQLQQGNVSSGWDMSDTP